MQTQLLSEFARATPSMLHSELEVKQAAATYLPDEGELLAATSAAIGALQRTQFKDELSAVAGDMTNSILATMQEQQTMFMATMRAAQEASTAQTQALQAQVAGMTNALTGIAELVKTMAVSNAARGSQVEQQQQGAVGSSSNGGGARVPGLLGMLQPGTTNSNIAKLYPEVEAQAQSMMESGLFAAGIQSGPAGLPPGIEVTQPRLALHYEAVSFARQDLAVSTLGHQQSVKYVLRVLLLLNLVEQLWAPCELVVCWVAGFFARSVGVGSVVNYLKGWKYLLRSVGWDLGVWQQWQVLPKVLRGMKRQLGAATRPKLPITPSMLLAFVQVMEGTTAALALWCAILVGFFGFLRKGHLCVDGVTVGDLPLSVLRRKHFRFDPVGYCVHITVVCSKTVQFRQREHEVTIQGVQGHALDPYAWLVCLFDKCPADAEAPAFGYLQGGVYVPLTYAKLLSGVKDLVRSAGLDPALYGGHSLRRGGATWAFECGVHPLFIRIQGDWRSDAWLLYVGLSEQQKRDVTRRMQEGILKLS